MPAWQMTLAYRTLLQRGMIDEFEEEEEPGYGYHENYTAIRITEDGLTWIDKNQARLELLSKPDSLLSASSSADDSDIDDIPF